MRGKGLLGLKRIFSFFKTFKKKAERINTLLAYILKERKILKIEGSNIQRDKLQSRKILALYFDGLPAKRMEIYGGPIPTPNLNSLASKGTLFKEMIVTSPSTSMTLTSLFTGLFPHEFGRFSWEVIDTSLPENCIPLIDILLDDGFKIYFLWDETFMSRRTQNKYKIIDWNKRDVTFFDIAHKEIQLKQVIDLLASLNRSNVNRWFCFVRFSDTTSCNFVGSAKSFSPYSWDDEIVEADTILGQILKIVDETIEIVVFSDHGKNYGQKGILKYSFNLTEQTLHIPFICSWGSGQIVDELTSIVEFSNIILKIPLRKHRYLYADTAYAHQWNRNTMIREGRWKYIYNRIGWPAPEEFYDIKYDSNELTNLAGKYKDPYRDSRPKGDTISTKFSPSGLNLDGKDVSEVYPRNDWDIVKKKLNELRKERERVWQLQGVYEENYE